MPISLLLFVQPSANKSPAGYNLHQLHGNKMHGSQKTGYLLKKSDGKVRKVWQRRKCIIHDGIMLVSHSDVRDINTLLLLDYMYIMYLEYHSLLFNLQSEIPFIFNVPFLLRIFQNMCLKLSFRHYHKILRTGNDIF